MNTTQTITEAIAARNAASRTLYAAEDRHEAIVGAKPLLGTREELAEWDASDTTGAVPAARKALHAAVRNLDAVLRDAGFDPDDEGPWS